MLEIIENQILEVNNLLSYRAKMKLTEIEQIGKKMDEVVRLAGAMREGNPITATYSVEGELADMEILIPLNKKLNNTDEFIFKEKIKIFNAVVAKHRGRANELQATCNELNKYILINKLVPITVGYNVTKNINPMSIEDIEIDVYVGISPNIL